jgi:hypothetical protein
MIEFVAKNVIIGGIIIVINLIPLITKKYKLFFLTVVLSVILAIIGNYAF